MGWISLHEASKARSEVYELGMKVMALENRVITLENEVRILKASK